MKGRIDAVELTRQLIRFDTVNPPGHERDCAEFLAGMLEDAGFTVGLHDFAPGRTTVIARLPGSGEEAPLAMTGHLDTVPFGHQPWSVDPLAGEIRDGKLYGRGASDMKSGVAALVASAIGAAGGDRPRRGLLLVLTAGEETGCEGAAHVASIAGLLGAASGLLVAEPTANQPSVGHKGALWLRGVSHGVTAHGSMPERGDNAVYKVAAAVQKLADFGFNQKPDPVLGSPTVNVGTISGGLNINSVPDHAEFTIDIRTTDTAGHAATLDQLRRYLGDEVELSELVGLEPVRTPAEDPFMGCVREAVRGVIDGPIAARALPFFTDASVLASALGAPTVILGPGETALAHQTDEYCFVDRIPEAVAAYRRIVEDWCRRP